MSIYGVSGSSSGSMAEALAQLRNAREQKDAGNFASSFISDHDTDDDGLLSVDETDLGEEQFSSIDSDGDGYLSADELTAEEERRQEMGAFNMGMRVPPTASEMASSLISELDADGDGSLSQEELDMDSDLFSSIDSDGDGTLSSEEITEDLQARMDEMYQATMQMNASSTDTSDSSDDASGVTTASASGTSETTASASGTQASSSSSEEEEYDDLDLNKDGTVSFDELRQAMMSGMFSGTLDGLGGESSGSDSGNLVSGFMRKMADQAYQTQMSQAASYSDTVATAV
ncbi:MAG: EF-hand domain-containing protein [Halodesulfovibrio sp.]